MRVLHVHNLANVPEVMVEYLKREGIDAKLVESVSGEDISRYDIIHAHNPLNMKTMHAYISAKRKKKKFIIHCHGSDVRILSSAGPRHLPMPLGRTSMFLRKHSDEVLLSTPDLMEFSSGTYIPNPVDVEKFKPWIVKKSGEDNGTKKSDRILIAGNQIKGSKLLDHISAKRQYDCIDYGDLPTFQKNVRVLPFVEYEKLPEFFPRYSEMIGTIGDPVTMTRLLAMSCGLRVFTDFPKKYRHFYGFEDPDKVADPRGFVLRYHNPKNVAHTLIEKYNEVLSSRL